MGMLILDFCETMVESVISKSADLAVNFFSPLWYTSMVDKSPVTEALEIFLPMSENPQAFLGYLRPVLEEIRAGK